MFGRSNMLVCKTSQLRNSPVSVQGYRTNVGVKNQRMNSQSLLQSVALACVVCCSSADTDACDDLSRCFEDTTDVASLTHELRYLEADSILLSSQCDRKFVTLQGQSCIHDRLLSLALEMHDGETVDKQMRTVEIVLANCVVRRNFMVHRVVAPPLLVATMQGDEAVVQMLLKAGYDVNASTPEGIDGAYMRTALHEAARPRIGSKLLVKLLLRHGASKEAVDSDGLTPYALAGTIELKALLSHGNLTEDAVAELEILRLIDLVRHGRSLTGQIPVGLNVNARVLEKGERISLIESIARESAARQAISFYFEILFQSEKLSAEFGYKDMRHAARLVGNRELEELISIAESDL